MGKNVSKDPGLRASVGCTELRGDQSDWKDTHTSHTWGVGRKSWKAWEETVELYRILRVALKSWDWLRHRAAL